MRIASGRCFALVAAVAVAACGDDSPEVALTNHYTVNFDLEATAGPVGALQFDVEYRGGGEAGWVGAGGGAACRWIVQAAIHACNDKRGGDLTCAVVDTGGFTGPIPLLECELIASDDTVTADDFDVRVTDASTPYLTPIDAEVSVSAVVAVAASTTTTTNPDDPPTEYDVVFGLPDLSPDPITALELDITHEGVVGGWIGNGSDVDCAWLVPADSQFCNEGSNRLLTCAAFSAVGFSSSLPLLECGFATYDPIVDTSDFSARVAHLSTPYGTPDGAYVTVVSVTPR